MGNHDQSLPPSALESLLFSTKSNKFFLFILLLAEYHGRNCMHYKLFAELKKKKKKRKKQQEKYYPFLPFYLSFSLLHIMLLQTITDDGIMNMTMES